MRPYAVAPADIVGRSRRGDPVSPRWVAGPWPRAGWWPAAPPDTRRAPAP